MPSSVILGMRYVPDVRELVIVYRGRRGTYRYFDVPMEEWVAFRGSGSKGTYLNEVFKGKGYRYEKVRLLEWEGEFLEWGEAWAFKALPAKSGRKAGSSL